MHHSACTPACTCMAVSILMHAIIRCAPVCIVHILMHASVHMHDSVYIPRCIYAAMHLRCPDAAVHVRCRACTLPCIYAAVHLRCRASTHTGVHLYRRCHACAQWRACTGMHLAVYYYWVNMVNYYWFGRQLWGLDSSN